MTTILKTAVDTALAAINTATTSWTGMEWQSGPQELLAALERGRLDPEVMGACWWPADGSNDSALLTERWHRLLRDVEEANAVTPELTERAQAMVEAERAYVEGRAEAAADEGRHAAECLALEDYDGALEAVERAARIENEFGDAPAWGPAVEAVKAVVDTWEAACAQADEALDELSEEDQAVADAELAEVEQAESLTPGQAWAEYVGQSVAEWLRNGGSTEEDDLEEYLAETWPHDVSEVARPIVASKLAQEIVRVRDDGVEVELDSPTGPRVVYHPELHDHAKVESSLPAGWCVAADDWSLTVERGEWRCTPISRVDTEELAMAARKAARKAEKAARVPDFIPSDDPRAAAHRRDTTPHVVTRFARPTGFLSAPLCDACVARGDHGEGEVGALVMRGFGTCAGAGHRLPVLGETVVCPGFIAGRFDRRGVVVRLGVLRCGGRDAVEVEVDGTTHRFLATEVYTG